MRILVSGASGFVGSHVVMQLLQYCGLEIIASSRSEERAKQAQWYSDVQFVPYDLDEPLDDLFTRFHKPDSLVHLAWPGIPDYKNIAHINQHLFSSYCFVRALAEAGVKNITVIGTCFEYGMLNGCLSEEMSGEPSTPYAVAKDVLRRMLFALQRELGFSLKWIRLFYLHGPGQHPAALLPQLDQAVERGDAVFNMSAGEQLRDYLPVAEAAAFITQISLQQSVQGVINCSSGSPISIRQLVERHLESRETPIKLNLGHFKYPEYEPMSFWGATKRRNAAIAAFSKEALYESRN